MPSLSLKLKWQDDSVQGIVLSPRTMILSVFSHVSTDDLEIAVILPDGVVLLAGELKTMHSIKKAQPIERRFLVEINDGAMGDIKIEARINYTGHTSFYAVGLLSVVDPNIDVNNTENQKGLSRSLKPENKKNYKRVLRNGEWLREYQLP